MTCDAEKLTLEWGERQGEVLWKNTFGRFDLPWRGARTLDFGCHWGYFCKHLLERQGVASACGVDIKPLWNEVTGWRPDEMPNLRLYAGDVRQIADLQEARFDILTSAGTFMLLEPSRLKAVLEWMFDHLRPGGWAVFRTRTYLSWCGGDLHRDLRMPVPHLLFPLRAIDAVLTERGSPPSRYMSPLCAASYLTLYRRVGFEVRAVTRVANRIEEATRAQFADKLSLYDPLELDTGELLVLLQRPAAPTDLSELTVCAAEASTNLETGSHDSKPAPAASVAPAAAAVPAAPAGAGQPARSAGRVDLKDKETIAWGRQQAAALWENLYSRYDPVVDGRTILDLGCSWGYLLMYLAERFRPAQLIGTDIKPWWQLRSHGWDYAALGERVRFYAGDVAEIGELPDRSVDLILCSSVLQYMTPEQIEANLNRAYDLLRPGGEMILRTRVFTSYVGADLHRDIELPYVHLLYSERDLARFLQENRGGKAPPYLNWLTASTYLAIFTRVGFEVLDAQRRPNRHAPEVLERVIAAYPWISHEELTCAELEAHLLRPLEPEELSRLV